MSAIYAPASKNTPADSPFCMPFNSLQFLYFFPVVIFLYFAVPYKVRWFLLLLASYYFYMCWRVEYLGLILISTIIVYFTSIQIEDAQQESRKRLFLGISVISNLGILFAFKYFNFFENSIQELFSHFNVLYRLPLFDVLLPVGISFYTFQIVGYSIDVYRGDKEAERHLGVFALFVVFFPQLVAGPIERSSNLLPQFFEKHDFDYQQATDGLKQMFWGLFKKVVIADRLAVLVDHVYANPTAYDGFPLVLATVFFVVQVYCDFSGYSDIAIGAARVMGFRLMMNFNRPYSARSISEYWRRWHISLTTWFNDYLFLPVVVRRRSWGFRLATVWALMVTFTLSGLWHGAYWTFIVFGMIHGTGLCLEYLTRKQRKVFSRRIPPALYSGLCLIGMLTFICGVDVFFRANTMGDAFYILQHMVTGALVDLKFLWGTHFSLGSIKSLFNGLVLKKTEIALAMGLIVFLELVQLVQSKVVIREVLQRRPAWQRWAVYYAMSIAFLFLGSFNNSIQFIYFQF